MGDIEVQWRYRLGDNGETKVNWSDMRKTPGVWGFARGLLTQEVTWTH